MSDSRALLAHQLDYYCARAPEYDEWFFRRGRYDRGPEANAAWAAEAAQVAAALEAFRPAGRVLELACGTGIWTAHLASHAAALTVVDGSPEMLALCRERVAYPHLRTVPADLFAWEPDDVYDVVFFSFWLSHVPEEQFAPFWGRVRRALAPGGRVFLIDSLHHEMATSADQVPAEPDAGRSRRRLNDGREFEVVKRFYEPAALSERLRALGWEGELRRTATFFLYGELRRAAAR